MQLRRDDLSIRSSSWFCPFFSTSMVCSTSRGDSLQGFERPFECHPSHPSIEVSDDGSLLVSGDDGDRPVLIWRNNGPSPRPISSGKRSLFAEGYRFKSAVLIIPGQWTVKSRGQWRVGSRSFQWWRYLHLVYSQWRRRPEQKWPPTSCIVWTSWNHPKCPLQRSRQHLIVLRWRENRNVVIGRSFIDHWMVHHLIFLLKCFKR